MIDLIKTGDGSVIDLMEDGAYFLPTLPEMVGSEADSTIRSGRSRCNATKCNENATKCNENATQSKSIEIEKEKETESESEIEILSGGAATNQATQSGDEQSGDGSVIDSKKH